VVVVVCREVVVERLVVVVVCREVVVDRFAVVDVCTDFAEVVVVRIFPDDEREVTIISIPEDVVRTLLLVVASFLSDTFRVEVTVTSVFLSEEVTAVV
jgi:hypothetical protein